MRLKAYAATTHQGPFLDLNEDAYDFDLDQRLFQVWDGFGGSGVGDRAVGALKEQVRAGLRRLGADPDATMPFYWSPRWLAEGNALINSLLGAHHQLWRDNQPLPLGQRAGASTVCAVQADDILVLGHAGNCHAFLLRNGHVEPLFIPDSHLFLSPAPTGTQALRLPAAGFGLFPELHWGMREVRVQDGDLFLLASEGLAGTLDSGELQHVLGRHDGDLHQRLNALLKLSNDKGNTANQTGMILEF